MCVSSCSHAGTGAGHRDRRSHQQRHSSAAGPIMHFTQQQGAHGGLILPT
ncbi:hypothetical protein ACCC84_22470 [Serratia odorifera]